MKSPNLCNNKNAKLHYQCIFHLYIHQDILNLIPDYVSDLIYDAIDDPGKPATWDAQKINVALGNRAIPKGSNFISEIDLRNWDLNHLIEKCTEKTIECYEEKIEKIESEFPFKYADFEREILLTVVDRYWIDHIDAMEKLKRGIILRSYANENPVNAYKKEGMEMFEEMTANIQEETVRLLLNAVFTKERQEQKSAPAQTPQRMTESLGENRQTGPIKAAKTPGRNDPCPCGSGKKYKNCCGKTQ